MAVKITYYVHATTTDNESGIATGWLPGELSATGRRQALELATLTTGLHFDAVFCSDLARAIESAELGFADQYEIITDQRLRECNYGELNGQPAAKFKDRLEDYVRMPFPNGESYCDVEHRLAEFVKHLRDHYQGRHVAIVAHQAPQLALDVLLRGRTWAQAIDEDWRKTHAWKAGWRYTAK